MIFKRQKYQIIESTFCGCMIFKKQKISNYWVYILWVYDI